MGAVARSGAWLSKQLFYGLVLRLLEIGGFLWPAGVWLHVCLFDSDYWALVIYTPCVHGLELIWASQVSTEGRCEGTAADDGCCQLQQARLPHTVAGEERQSRLPTLVCTRCSAAWYPWLSPMLEWFIALWAAAEYVASLLWSRCPIYPSATTSRRCYMQDEFFALLL